jgi:hypothetical protein
MIERVLVLAMCGKVEGIPLDVCWKKRAAGIKEKPPNLREIGSLTITKWCRRLETYIVQYFKHVI